MKPIQIICFYIVFFGVVHAQNNIEKALKNTRYTKQGNQKLKKEWNNSSGGIIQSSVESHYDSDRVLVDKQSYSDSILAGYHEKYQAHLAKKQIREKNLLKEPELPEMPTFDGPDFHEPDIPKPGTLPPWILNVLLIIVIGFGLFIIFYIILRNTGKSKNNFKKFDDYWNPEIIPVSDLEQRLKQSIIKKKYREAVRIYFTMILKELIRLNQIKWTREKTNLEYLISLRNRSFYTNFSSCIHVFDVIWYGEYEIDFDRFNEVEPIFIAFLNTLKTHE